MVAREQSIVDALGHFLAQAREHILLLLGLGNDFRQLFLLAFQIGIAHLQLLLASRNDLGFLLCLRLALTNALLTQLNLQCLVFDFLIQGSEFTVVSHIVLLLRILRNQRLAVFDLNLIGRDALVDQVEVLFQTL